MAFLWPRQTSVICVLGYSDFELFDMCHKVLSQKNNSTNILEKAFSLFSAVSSLIELLCLKLDKWPL